MERAPTCQRKRPRAKHAPIKAPHSEQSCHTPGHAVTRPERVLYAPAHKSSSFFFKYPDDISHPAVDVSDESGHVSCQIPARRDMSLVKSKYVQPDRVDPVDSTA